MRRGRSWRLGVAALATGLGVSAPTRAAELSVGAGSTLELGSGSLDAGCADLLVGGTLALDAGSASQVRDLGIQPGGALQGGAGSLEVAGDWTNAGSFSAGTGTVLLADGCGRTSAALSQSNAFYRLFLSSATGKLFQFEAGSTQTVARRFEANGTSTDLLRIRSTAAGLAANIDLQGGQATSWLDVGDNHAIGYKQLFGAGSLDAGNTDGWVFANVPVLPAAGLLLAAGGLAWAARRRLSPQSQGGA